MMRVVLGGFATVFVMTFLLVACNSRTTVNPVELIMLPQPRSLEQRPSDELRPRQTERPHDDTQIDGLIQSVEQARETVERRAYILDHRAAKELP